MMTSAASCTRDYVSYSAIRTFQSCPLKYRYRYVDGLAEERVSAGLIFGSAIHAALEFYYSEQLSGAVTPTIEDLLVRYDQSWSDRPAVEVEYSGAETRDTLRSLADRMLRGFLSSDHSRPEGQIIGVEEAIRGELIPGIPELLGYVDLLIETRDAVLIRDFKTSRSAWDSSQANDQSDQLLLYADLVRQAIPDKTIRLQFVVLTKTREPKVQLLEPVFSERRQQGTKRMIEVVWSAIQAGHFYPSPSPLQCGTCGFRRHCEAWRGSSVEKEHT